MSRYTIEDSKGARIVYGFDRPISQYFVQKERKHLLGPMSANYGNCVEMEKTLRDVQVWDKIPEQHQEAIVSDNGF